VANGERDAGRALAAGREILARERIEPEYLAAVAADTLAPVMTITGETLIPIAARVGNVRLIDNVTVRPGSVA
jgi:pantoate--beta-alanine ligase